MNITGVFTSLKDSTVSILMTTVALFPLAARNHFPLSIVHVVDMWFDTKMGVDYDVH